MSEPLPSPGVPAPGAPTPPADLPVEPGRRDLLFLAVLALVLTFGLFLYQRRLDFYVAEEGFLWYGAIGAAHGEVPFRDFYSYDPGRYYWAAAGAELLGDGLLALRLSAAVFQALGLFCGLWAAWRLTHRRWLLALVGLLLLVWMEPRNRLFEPAIAMAGVAAAVALLEKPTLRRHFAAGALVGLGLFFGKNHGLYLAVAFLLLILLLRWRWPAPGEPGLPRRLGAWVLGGVAGTSPLLLMLAFVPGFFGAYVDSIRFFLEAGQTNFPLPIPWPWRVDFAGQTPFEAARDLAEGVGFLLFPLFLAAATLVILLTRRSELRSRALLVGSGALSLVYLHYAFSRADIVHLAPSLHPVLLGLAALPGLLRGRKRIAAGLALGIVLAAVTAFGIVPTTPWYKEATLHPYRPYMVAGDELRLLPRTVNLLSWVERKAERIPPNERLLLVPNLTGLYPVLGRRSPAWDIYPIWPASPRLDRRMLDEIRAKDVRWVILDDYAVDGRDELRFEHTHPQVASYIEAEFERAEKWRRKPGPWGAVLLVKRAAVPAQTTSNLAGPGSTSPISAAR
jgi:hypothetical protein